MNKYYIKCLFCFFFGIACGFLSANYFLDKKYEQILQEEICSLKKFYASKECIDMPDIDSKKETDTKQSDVFSPMPEKDMNDYVDYTKLYSTPREVIKKPKNELDSYVERPYVIKPEEFGEIEGYSTISLSYYADGILADENDDIVDSPEDTVGTDFLNHFGEYEYDSVYIRNDAKLCDYEILKDLRKYEAFLQMGEDE